MLFGHLFSGDLFVQIEYEGGQDAGYDCLCCVFFFLVS